MKVMLIEPGASWSTYDVAMGLLYGLERQGIQVIRYRLSERIAVSNRVLFYAWRKAKQKTPTIDRPTEMDTFVGASKDAVFMAHWHQVDVVLAVSGLFLPNMVMDVMRRSGLRISILFTESPYDRREIEIAKSIDACWTNELSSVKSFREVNQFSGYMPHAWHPELHKAGPQPGDDQLHSHDVVFVGSGFQERIDWLNAIDWTGIDLGLYGTWDSLGSRHRLRQYIKGGVTSNAMTSALYRRAKVGLNLYRTSKGWGKDAPQIAHAESLNPRAYELAACGAFHLSTYRSEIADVFGGLVPTFQTPDEASALIRAWLADPKGRAEVAAELPKCVRGMSWTDRAAQIINDLRILLRPQGAEILHPRSQAVGAA